MNNLALDFGFVSDYSAARDLLQRTYVEQSQSSGGVSRADVLSSWSDLSRVVRLAGGYAEARLLAEDAYEFGRQELGVDHPWTLRTGKELSIALRMAGESADEVVATARDLLKQFERVLGITDPDTLAASTNLANTLALPARSTRHSRLHRTSWPGTGAPTQRIIRTCTAAPATSPC